MTPLLNSFNGVLRSFNEGSVYKSQPPTGPPLDWPMLTTEELAAMDLTDHGENKLDTDPYTDLELLKDDGIFPRTVPFPSSDFLSDLNICGIDGSNQRIERNAFYLILARAAIVNFRYSSDGSKPYFKNKIKDFSSMMVVDQSVFDIDKLNIHTSLLTGEKNNIGKSVNRFFENYYQEPIAFTYNINNAEKSPSSQALGIAVKFMQTLELKCLEEISSTKRTVCIKDGPLLPTSVDKYDALKYLNLIESWQDQILIGSSKRISESRLLVQALRNIPLLREKWFPSQNITDKTLNLYPSDSLLLHRILKPGERTPLFKAIAKQKIAIVKKTNENIDANENLTPYACYYLSRSKPHTYLRFEVPLYFINKGLEHVNNALSVVAWQHELGRIAPLVQIVADERCQLASEKQILERQTEAALKQKDFQFLQNY